MEFKTFVRVIIPDRLPPTMEKHYLIMQEPLYGDNLWCFPGGKFEPVDRNYVDTAIREAREEVGIDVMGLELLMSRQFPDFLGRDIHWTGVFYKASSYRGWPKIMEPDKQKQLEFKTFSEIQDLPQIASSVTLPLLSAHN